MITPSAVPKSRFLTLSTPMPGANATAPLVTVRVPLPETFDDVASIRELMVVDESMPVTAEVNRMLLAVEVPLTMVVAYSFALSRRKPLPV